MQASARNQTLYGFGRRGGLFLKSDSIGFQIFPTFGGREVPKGRYMKSDLADFIADSEETTPPAGLWNSPQRVEMSRVENLINI